MDATIFMKELGTREMPGRERCTFQRRGRPGVKGTTAKLPTRSRVRTSQRPGVWVCRASEEQTLIPKRPDEAAQAVVGSGRVTGAAVMGVVRRMS